MERVCARLLPPVRERVCGHLCVTEPTSCVYFLLFTWDVITRGFEENLLQMLNCVCSHQLNYVGLKNTHHSGIDGIRLYCYAVEIIASGFICGLTKRGFKSSGLNISTQVGFLTC